MRELFARILSSSINNLLATQPDILVSTTRTGMTEWTLCHHLTNEIAKYIFWLNHDVDVTKRNYGNERPDIIFHKRQRDLLNLLVVELKKNGKRADIGEDIYQIQRFWMSEPLNYQFGASVNIRRNGLYNILLYEKGIDKPFEADNNTNQLNIPNILELKNEIKNIVNRIYGLEKNFSLHAFNEYKKRYMDLINELYQI